MDIHTVITSDGESYTYAYAYSYESLIASSNGAGISYRISGENGCLTVFPGHKWNVFGYKDDGNCTVINYLTQTHGQASITAFGAENILTLLSN